MPVYNDRQVRHLYVATKRYAAATAHATLISKADSKNTYVPGSIQCNTIMNGKALQFMYKNANKEYVTSDVIPIANIRNVTKSTPKGMVYKTHTITIAKDPVVGEDYIVRFELKAWFTPDTSRAYIKDAVYRAKGGDDKNKIASGLQTSINQIFKREPWQPFTISVSGATITLVEKNSDEYWKVDRCHEVPTQCTITAAIAKSSTGKSPDKIDFEDNTWATIASETAYYGNARETAQLEYQCMKGRADLYGYMGYPNVNPSAMMITGTPAATDNYVYLDIQYAFAEDGTNNAFSEKEITIVSQNTSIITDLETEVKIAIASLSNPTKPSAPAAETPAAEDASVQTQSAPAKADKIS